MGLPEQEAGEISRKASILLCERIYSAKKKATAVNKLRLCAILKVRVYLFSCGDSILSRGVITACRHLHTRNSCMRPVIGH